MDDLNPFWSANKLAVTKALKDKGYFDIYINNFIWVVVYIGGNKAYLKAAPGTVIHSIFHCTYNPKHVKRDNMIAKDKFQAEGAISEEHIYLWLILNTRKILIQLPMHKCIASIGYLDSFFDHSSSSHKDILSLIWNIRECDYNCEYDGSLYEQYLFPWAKGGSSRPTLSKY